LEGTRKIWTVSELNRAAGELLEEAFPRIWVEGEISNWKLYPSGHAYFSLKDSGGQISAVLFRAAAKNFRFEPRDGLAVLAAGRVGLYSQRGQYQLIVEELEPRGTGALQLAFEQLKEKLRASARCPRSRAPSAS
jgi:exodeoxyribonuclease VII large subunit